MPVGRALEPTFASHNPNQILLDIKSCVHMRRRMSIRLGLPAPGQSRSHLSPTPHFIAVFLLPVFPLRANYHVFFRISVLCCAIFSPPLSHHFFLLLYILHTYCHGKRVC